MLVIPGRGQGVAGEVSSLLGPVVESMLQVVEFLPFAPLPPSFGVPLISLDRLQGVDEQGILPAPPVYRCDSTATPDGSVEVGSAVAINEPHCTTLPGVPDSGEEPLQVVVRRASRKAAFSRLSLLTNPAPGIPVHHPASWWLLFGSIGSPAFVRGAGYNDAMNAKPVIRLYGLVHGCGLIIPYPSGVFYLNQAGGVACAQRHVEGVYLPTDWDGVEDAMEDIFGGGSLREDDAARIDAAISAQSLGDCEVRVDRACLKESCEAWVWVTVAGRLPNVDGMTVTAFP
jgi:hypothetical protein